MEHIGDNISFSNRSEPSRIWSNSRIQEQNTEWMRASANRRQSALTNPAETRSDRTSKSTLYGHGGQREPNQSNNLTGRYSSFFFSLVPILNGQLQDQHQEASPARQPDQGPRYPERHQPDGVLTEAPRQARHEHPGLCPHQRHHSGEVPHGRQQALRW